MTAEGISNKPLHKATLLKQLRAKAGKQTIIPTTLRRPIAQHQLYTLKKANQAAISHPTIMEEGHPLNPQRSHHQALSFQISRMRPSRKLTERLQSTSRLTRVSPMIQFNR